MKYRGVARKIDDLGRIVVPVEMRRALGLSPGDEVDMSLDEAAIVLRKVEPGCTFCGSTEGLREFRGRQVCGSCSTELSDNS